MSFILTSSCQSIGISVRNEPFTDLNRIQIYILCIIIVFFHYYINIKYYSPSILKTLWQSELIHLIQLKSLRERNYNYYLASVWSIPLASEMHSMKPSWKKPWNHCVVWHIVKKSETFIFLTFKIRHYFLWAGVMSNNMQAFLYKYILRYPKFREANHTTLGVSLEAPTVSKSGYAHTTG